MDRLESIRWCPTQFQAFVDGTNVRVHTVDRRLCYSNQHDATDYRYAHRQGGKRAELRAVELSDHLAEMCVKLLGGTWVSLCRYRFEGYPGQPGLLLRGQPQPGV